MTILQVLFPLTIFLIAFALLYRAYFIVRIQYIIHTTYKMGVNRPFMLLVRLLVKSRLLVFRESKVIRRFSKPALLKGQLEYIQPNTATDVSSSREWQN